MKMKLHDACRRSGFLCCLVLVHVFLYIAVFIVSVLWRVTFTCGSMTPLSHEEWRKNERARCVFNTALSWDEKPLLCEVPRKPARDREGDQTFQMIRIQLSCIFKWLLLQKGKAQILLNPFPTAVFFPLLHWVFERFAFVWRRLGENHAGDWLWFLVVCPEKVSFGNRWVKYNCSCMRT